MHAVKLGLLSLALGRAFAFSGGAARADALPPDYCSSAAQVGSMCGNAGPMSNEPGVCVMEMCAHPLPDGGSAPYACAKCVPVDGGSPSDAGGQDGTIPLADAEAPLDAANPGDATHTEAGPGVDASSSHPTDSSGSSSGGCAMTPFARDGATGFAMLGLGIAALVWGRRRRG